MFLQPPKQPFQPFFFPGRFHCSQTQPHFMNPHLQLYICNPPVSYHVFPTTGYFQRPLNTPLNPRMLPPPGRNTRIKKGEKAASSTTCVLKWVPKKKEQKASTSVRGRNAKESSSSSSVIIPFPKSPHKQNRSTTTTLMMRNIPNHFGRSDLLGVLKDYCLDENLKKVLRSEPAKKSEFDFLYLPMDFKEFWENERISNLGYAFVNFTSSDAALRFYKRFHKFKWPVSINRKVCEVTCADTQGKEALKKRFKNKIFWCHSNEFLPVLLAPPSDGVTNSNLVNVGKLTGKPKVYKKK